MRTALPAQLHAVVDQSFGVQPCCRPGLAQGVDGGLFEDSRPLTLLDVGAIAALQDDAADAGTVEQAGQQQPGGAAPDDSHGRVHRSYSFTGAVAFLRPFARGAFAYRRTEFAQ